MTRKIVAVTGASGRQGSAICTAFAAAGWQVRALARSAAPAADPDSPHIERQRIAAYEADALAEAFAGADTAVLNAPIDYRLGVREALAAAVACAAEQAGVRRIVLNTGAEPFEGYARRISQSLFAMRAILAEGTVGVCVVQPTVFMENLLAPALAAGICAGRFAYPLPADARVAWISHADLGRAVVAAAVAPESGVFRIGGPEALTGSDVARLLANATGREVRYEPLAPDRFARLLPVDTGPHIADYYRRLARFPEALARRDGSLGLGLRPESFAEWAARQDWRIAARAAA